MWRVRWLAWVWVAIQPCAALTVLTSPFLNSQPRAVQDSDEDDDDDDDDEDDDEEDK